MRSPLWVLSVLLASPCLAGGGDAEIPVTGRADCAVGPQAVDPAAALDAANRLRAAAKLPPVAWSAALARAAQAHAEDLAARARLSHIGGNGSRMTERVQTAGYAGFARAENVAWNQPNTGEVMEAWAESAAHRENMLLPDVREIGIGYACASDKGRFWVLDLGSAPGLPRSSVASIPVSALAVGGN